VADPDPNDIPDLDLPPPRGSTPNISVPPVKSGAPSSGVPAKTSGAPGSFGGSFGMDLERGAVSAPPVALSGAPNVSIEIGHGDDFDMELERGGAMISLPPALSGRPSGGPVSSGRPPMSSGRPLELEISYKRESAKSPAISEGPSTVEKLGAFALTSVACLGMAALLVKLAHRSGGRNVMTLMPGVFDASSTVQSGSFALAALVLGIALGFIGFKLSPRSYAIVGSACTLVIASLAMVTVTLVSTEEHPTPPDGALLIPYLVPLGLALLGLGIAGRGVHRFYEGGARRGLTVLLAAIGGALVFAAIELSALASRLP
jgi:hypothetical protein